MRAMGDEMPEGNRRRPIAIPMDTGGAASYNGGIFHKGKAAKKAAEKAMDQFIATQGRKSPLNAPARLCSPACSPVWDNSPIRRPPRQERSP